MRGRWIPLLGAFWRLNLAEELQYRANFVASVLGTLFSMATALLTLSLFFHHTTSLGGWDYWEIVVLLGVFNALSGVIEAVLRPGIGQLAGEVRSGDLDLVLVKPVDAQGFVSFRRLDIWRFADVVLGLALAGYALTRLGRIPSAAQLVAFALALASAAVVVYAIWVVLMSLAFWFVSVENIAVLFDAVYEGARYPVSAYPGALRFDRVDHDHPGVGAHGPAAAGGRARGRSGRGAGVRFGARVVARGDQAIRRRERVRDRPTCPSTPLARYRWDR